MAKRVERDFYLSTARVESFVGSERKGQRNLSSLFEYNFCEEEALVKAAAAAAGEGSPSASCLAAHYYTLGKVKKRGAGG